MKESKFSECLACAERSRLQQKYGRGKTRRCKEIAATMAGEDLAMPS
jgi:hypothetical protein